MSGGYEALSEAAQEQIDKAAAKLVEQWGLSLADARELVLEHLISRTSRGDVGTGH